MWIESYPGRTLREAWLYLSPGEAQNLLDLLSTWASGAEPADPQWSTCLTDDERTLTVLVSPEAGTAEFARRFER